MVPMDFRINSRLLSLSYYSSWSHPGIFTVNSFIGIYSFTNLSYMALKLTSVINFSCFIISFLMILFYFFDFIL